MDAPPAFLPKFLKIPFLAFNMKGLEDSKHAKSDLIMNRSVTSATFERVLASSV